MSGGAGTQSAGSGGAGVVYTTVGEGIAAEVPIALRYDGASKDFPLDPTTGQYLGCHPVDQRVALALLVRFGTLKSLPNFGSKFHQIPLDLRAEQSARAEVDRVLKSEVDSGNIKIIAVQVEVRRVTTGVMIVKVLYLNLKASDPTRIREASNSSTQTQVF